MANKQTPDRTRLTSLTTGCVRLSTPKLPPPRQMSESIQFRVRLLGQQAEACAHKEQFKTNHVIAVSKRREKSRVNADASPIRNELEAFRHHFAAKLTSKWIRSARFDRTQPCCSRQALGVLPSQRLNAAVKARRSENPSRALMSSMETSPWRSHWQASRWRMRACTCR